MIVVMMQPHRLQRDARKALFTQGYMMCNELELNCSAPHVRGRGTPSRRCDRGCLGLRFRAGWNHNVSCSTDCVLKGGQKSEAHQSTVHSPQCLRIFIRRNPRCIPRSRALSHLPAQDQCPDIFAAAAKSTTSLLSSPPVHQLNYIHTRPCHLQPPQGLLNSTRK
jgi:hypothetical protein